MRAIPVIERTGLFESQSAVFIQKVSDNLGPLLRLVIDDIYGATLQFRVLEIRPD